MNGDGQADFATAAWYYDSGKGAVYVFYGPVETGEHDPEDVADSIIEGSSTYGYFGYSVDQAGDVNNDGFDDLIAGTQSYNNGKAYLFLGPLAGDTTTAGADGIWSGEGTSDYAGQGVAGGFDFDADGNGDTLIGAYAASSYSGAVYLVYGPGTGENDLGDAPVKITGSLSYGYLGQNGSLTGVPDMNGDGQDEFAVGQYAGSSYAGAVYLFYGSSLGGEYTTADADVTYTGASYSDYLGMRIGRATDFNGDGLGDVMMGAYAADTGGSYTGSVYIVPGPGDTSGRVSSIALAELYGESPYQYIGQNDMDGEMDINRDDYTDLVIGSAYTSAAGVSYGGIAYVVYGPQTGDVSLSDARCRLYGTTTYGYAGQAVSFIGDQSGDDSPEVLVGAPYDASYAGVAYVVWGDRL
jgi:glycosylphosphatidylinositol phospholipase D